MTGNNILLDFIRSFTHSLVHCWNSHTHARLPFVSFQVENVSARNGAVNMWTSGREKKILAKKNGKQFIIVKYNITWVNHQCERWARSNFFYCSIMWIMRNSQIHNLWKEHRQKTIEKCSYIREEFVIERQPRRYCGKVRIRLVIGDTAKKNICNSSIVPRAASATRKWKTFALLVNTSYGEWTKNIWALKSVKGQSRCSRRWEYRQRERVLWKFQHK